MAIKFDPGYADAYHNLGNAQFGLAQKTNSPDLYKEAAQNYLSAIKYNPRLWQSYQNLGVIYFNNGSLDKAIEYTAKASEINSGDINLKINLGALYLKSGNTQKARGVFEMILKADPTNQKVQQILKNIDSSSH